MYMGTPWAGSGPISVIQLCAGTNNNLGSHTVNAEHKSIIEKLGKTAQPPTRVAVPGSMFRYFETRTWSTRFEYK